jgi:hypothetical protein
MCNFSIPFTGTADDLFNNLQTQIQNAGGKITGDSTGGSFSLSSPVTIDGTFTISGQTLAIVITHKPILPTCGQIENYIKSHLV